VTGITVLKLGGELLEPDDRLALVAQTIADARLHASALVVVHGGGRAIDAMLGRLGITPRQVNGLRITDAATLDVVVSVLAGSMNTRLVAALNAAGTSAVGITGADARVLPVRQADPVRTIDGLETTLGFVGEPEPAASNAELIEHLAAGGYVPVVASIAADSSGALYNVNADTFAAALAAVLHAERLVIAGTTSGVLDKEGATIAALLPDGADALIASGGATAGMIAKLRACMQAVESGVGSVVIVDGSSIGDAVAGRHNGHMTAVRAGRPAVAGGAGVEHAPAEAHA
jgi:acetylglutamate kinase